MSIIEKIIKVYCHNDVDYKRISDIASVDIGEFVKKDKQGDDKPYPVYNGGISNTGFYSDYNHEGNFILISARGANAGFVNFISGKYWAGNSCYSIDVNSSLVNYKYLYHFMKFSERTLLGVQQRGGIPAISKKQVCDFIIPVPPIEVQCEIVRILDNFTELTAELTAELDCRKKQYAAISTKLFEHAKEIGKEYTLSDICKIEKGNTPIQKSVPGQYTLVVTTSERKTSDKYQFDSEAVCIPLVSSRGHGVASLNHVYYQKGKFALGNILCAVLPRDDRFVSARYLYYYFEQTKDYTLVPLMKGGANVALHISDIGRITVPMPSFEFQQSIVKQLDVFEKYCNDELPAEIAARQKQYEYYRDRLLSFKEI